MKDVDPEMIYTREEAYGMQVQLPKTWTGIPMMSKHPLFCIYENSELEPCYVPNERVLEDCLRKEADRISNQGSLMNRLIYDSVEASPLYDYRRDLKNDNPDAQELNKEDLYDVKYQIPNQLEELKNLKIWYSIKQDGDVYNKERPDGTLPPYYYLQSPYDQTLVFESRFESGNLRRAIQVYEYEYDLILKPDYNTRGNTQWFYFSVSNTRKDRVYKFNIINLLKNDSLYNHGLRPLSYSEKGCRLYQIITGEKQNIDSRQGLYFNIDEWKSTNSYEEQIKDYTKMWGWRRTGENICYYQNNIKRRSSGYYYTLSFTVKFDFDYDTVYFCHSYPYTYTNLNKWLNCLEEDAERKKILKRRLLCQTIAGNSCDYLTITDFAQDYDENKNQKSKKRGIVLSARVHPGETFASYMLHGLVDYLTGSSIEAKILRENFVFKIVPMLNIDGVVNGSNRCNLAGVDLNRQWLDPSRRLHPTIFSTKSLIKRFMEEREVVLFCDFHAHSRKKNIFMYGNSNPKNVNAEPNTRLRERIFPKLLENASPIFNFQDCNFAISKAKESCGRVVAYKEYGLVNSYTLEASYCGSDYGTFRDYHFNSYLTQEIGKSFCEAVVDMFDPDQTKVKNTIRILDNIIPVNDSNSNYFKPAEDSGGGSSSDEKEGKVKRNKTPNTQASLEYNKGSSKAPTNGSKPVVANVVPNFNKKDKIDKRRTGSQGPEKKSSRGYTSDNAKDKKK